MTNAEFQISFFDVPSLSMNKQKSLDTKDKDKKPYKKKYFDYQTRKSKIQMKGVSEGEIIKH